MSTRHKPGNGVHSFVGTDGVTGTQQQQGALLSMRLYPSWMESLWEDEPRPCADLPGAGMRYNGWEPLKHSQGSL